MSTLGESNLFVDLKLKNEDVTGKMATERMYQRTDPKVHSFTQHF